MVVTRGRGVGALGCLVGVALALWAPSASAQPSPSAPPPPAALPPAPPSATPPSPSDTPPTAPLPSETPPPPPPTTPPNSQASPQSYPVWSPDHPEALRPAFTPFPDQESASSPPPAPAVTNWQLYLEADATYSRHQSFDRFGSPYGASELAGGHEVQLARFIKPLRDDDAPRSLQPFLQHASTVAFTMDVGGSSYRRDSVTCVFPANGSGCPDARAYTASKNVFTGPAVGFDIYAVRWLAVTGGVSYQFDLTKGDVTTKTHGFHAHGGLGLHFGDTRVDLSYAFKAFDVNGSFYPLQWGTLTLSLETVFAHRVELDVAGEAFEGGAGGSVGLEVFINKSIGIFANGFAYEGRHYDDVALSYNNYGAKLGAAFWVVPRLRLQASYQISGTDEPAQTNPFETRGSSAIYHQFVVAALARIP